MRRLRPVVETGFENILLTRLLLEEKHASQTMDPIFLPPRNPFALYQLPCFKIPAAERQTNKNRGPGMRDLLLQRYGATKEELVGAFGATRDAWMAEDMMGWMDANRW
ncbi:unnamed protein product, partial [Phaeothamnion confervicola]